MFEIIIEKHRSIIEGILSARREKLKNAFPELPLRIYSLENINKYIDIMIEMKTGWICEIDGKIGYIFSFYLQDMFYQRPGAYTPEWGHELPSERHYEKLLKVTYDTMVEKGCVDHSISFYNTEDQLKTYLYENAYGSRCMDANAIIENRLYDFKAFAKASSEDLDFLCRVLDDHHAYMNQAPIFLGFEFETSSRIIKAWLEDDACDVFLIYHKDQPIGFTYLNYGGSGGSDTASDEKTLGIETTHILKEFRGMGYLNKLIDFYHGYGYAKGYTNIAVDYETMNYKAKKAWSKHFKETIRSVVRNIG